MQSTYSLSRDQWTSLVKVLNGVAVGAFGSTATLPLFCLGEFRIANPQEPVNEHYARWQASLTDAREIANSDARLAADADPVFSELTQIIEDIRDAFCLIARLETLPRDSILAAYESLLIAYDHLPVCISTLNTICCGALDSTVQKLDLRALYYQRTLRWIGDELRERLAGKNAAPSTISVEA